MKLSVIVPCYNEEPTIPIFYEELQKIQTQIKYQLEYIFVNDGSKDKTLAELRKLASEHDNVRYISFSRNFGKESALYAGLQASTGELVTVMDVDLQDPPELIPEMIDLIENDDYDCVATRRENRDGEPIIRSFFARKFYQIINKISDTKMVNGARDYRLMTRQMVDSILELSETNRFSKGLFSWVGFKTKFISFTNRERVAGETSWSFWKLLKYAINGISDFSSAPLHLATWSGGLFSTLAGIGIIWIIIRKILSPEIAISGWSSIIALILFIGGIQLLCLGILGEYIGKIFNETKNRPIYIVKETEKSNPEK
ncbi:glycosyltransferase family 2 protein [Lactobacillus sp. YT155]|uniref:glycosyltransferase family 2 protein n=1 Tax=Lactobacillus sp. YT155 TaxID=3060955 RepID=UPI00265FF857|nr:glycosyltransferase family 2 protein [Lactobacillus sp. YT155]MDO1604647.1 glycosyltransferase family 2 protein [Lactobacillus sp. YT155]